MVATRTSGLQYSIDWFHSLTGLGSLQTRMLHISRRLHTMGNKRTLRQPQLYVDDDDRLG